MSEQQAEQTAGEAPSVTPAPTVQQVSDPLIEQTLASVQEVGAAVEIAPDHETLPKEDPPKVETPEIKAETPQFDASVFPTPKPGAVRIDVAKTEPKFEAPRPSAKVLIMAPGEPAREDVAAGSGLRSDQATGETGKRRFGAMAAVALVALAAGAIGGSLASGLTHRADAAAAASDEGSSVNAAIARIDAEILSLKAGLERTGKQETSQLNRTNDRLDKIEKAQAEPAAKLARLTEAVDKLRGASAAAPPVAAVATTPALAKEKEAAVASTSAPTRDITGSVPPAPAATSQQASAAATPLKNDRNDKTDFGRLPKVDGWVLRDVSHGGALIEGRQGLYEVYAGDPVPGLGRVDAIRKQDGRWVVVTTKGLVVAR
ncbi:MAG: hypothetical protein JOY90_32265 [Bradyrhizobium sp.]|uniref:hypothetical protein n=1 Tax=Bradyrhizobium sp. TaxID=376 RepID=UPI001D26F9E6|nr:hypothetical protein [Bradyrhizobium sp.]MBV9565089.1 hypothetical protein [Bradyrhizobium sp.]